MFFGICMIKYRVCRRQIRKRLMDNTNIVFFLNNNLIYFNEILSTIKHIYKVKNHSILSALLQAPAEIGADLGDCVYVGDGVLDTYLGDS